MLVVTARIAKTKMMMLLLSSLSMLFAVTTTTIKIVHAQPTSFAPLLEDNVSILRNVPGIGNARASFVDSYSDGDACYCSISTFDHGIGDVVVETAMGMLTVRQICQMLGDGPGPTGRPLYNDIQCGNGPPNDAGDEDDCPGRVEYGREGCAYVGPTWNFTAFLSTTERPTTAPVRTTRAPTTVTPTTIAPTRFTSFTTDPTRMPITRAPVQRVPPTQRPIRVRTEAPTSTNVPSLTLVPSTTVVPTTNPTRAPVPRVPPTQRPVRLRTEAPTSTNVPSMTLVPSTTVVPTANPTRAPVPRVPSTTQRPVRVRTEAPTASSLPTVPPITDVTNPRAMITDLTLCDTTRNPATKLRDLDRRGTLLDLAVTGTNITIVADFKSETDNVHLIFTVDDTYSNDETNPPFVLNGNNGTQFRPFRPLGRVGTYTIVASLFIKNTDTLLDTLTVEVTVIDTRIVSPGPLDRLYLIDTSTQRTRTFSSPFFVDLNQYGTALSLGIETNDDSAASVVFWSNDIFVNREWNNPWTLGGNDKTFFHPSPLLSVPGRYIITAVAMASNNNVLGYTQIDLVLSDGMSTKRPTRAPARSPTRRTPMPSFGTMDPTVEPTISVVPSYTDVPEAIPTIAPSMIEPTLMPTDFVAPVNLETDEPIIIPTNAPSMIDPTLMPTDFVAPVNLDTDEPTMNPTMVPPIVPLPLKPTTSPTAFVASVEPSSIETLEPTTSPTSSPTAKPTDDPPTFVPNPETDEPFPDLTRSPTTKSPMAAPVVVPTPIVTPTVGNAVITGELRKWHKVTLAFTGPFASETDPNTNPFMDYRLDVTFTHRSSNNVYVVPGYFAADGDAAESSSFNGTQWHCHFSPDAIGMWDYKTSFVRGKNVAVSSGGTTTSFHGDAGSFTVLGSNKTGRDHRRKGRLQYIGQHHLRFAEGEYFLKAGADSPENFLAYDDFDNTPNFGDRRKSWSPHEIDFSPGDPTWQNGKGKGIIGAINYLSNEGMNVFSFLTLNIEGDDKNVFPYISDSQDDRLRMDVSKLAQWEIIFEHADKMGMYLHFKTSETENDQLLDGGALGNERKLYYRELIARFSHHLALNWNLSEEISNTVEQIEEFSDYFKELDPYDHMVVFHTGSNSDFYSNFLGYKSIDGASLQNTPALVFRNTLRWVTQSAAAGKKWVVANDEQNSAMNGVLPDSVDPDHDIIREEVLWGNIMAGGAGVEYYFGYGFENSDLTCEDFRSRANMWKQSRYALDFFRDNDIKFWEMSNDNSRLPDDSSDYVLSSEDGGTLIVFRPNGNGSVIDMLELTGTYGVQWYNPREGGPLVSGTITIIEGGGLDPRNFGSAPESNDRDWVVLIKKL